MLPEQIYQPSESIVPAFSLEVIRHTDMGDRVICAKCTVNGARAMRLTQDIYGQPVNPIPVWNVNGRIVADWFALILESRYQECVIGQTVVIEPDLI